MKIEEYRVDCVNEECGWSGLSTECDDGFCPDCGDNVEEVAE